MDAAHKSQACLKANDVPIAEGCACPAGLARDYKIAPTRRNNSANGRLACAPLLWRRAMSRTEPSSRKLVGIALIVLLIVVWAAFVASLARIVGSWPILVQAPFYLIMGIAWVLPLKPLVRWIQTGSFRVR